jgi:FKBP-type peptidyl-prolyl cis-trans isomerase
MKIYSQLLVAALLLSKINQAQTISVTTKPVANSLKNYTDSASYVLGYNLGQNIALKYTDLNVDILNKAVKDALANKPAQINTTLTQSIMSVYAIKMAKKNGEKFLATNKKRKGVTTTASGLQYEVLTQGTGVKPKATDIFVANYSGKLLNGVEFDASSKSGKPLQMGVNQVIRGWVEGLQLMNVGSKYKLFIPDYLAYGDYGSGAIGPGETLIFEIELLNVISNK